jgi:hypothetical protein
MSSASTIVPLMDAQAKFDPHICRHGDVAFGHLPLHRHCAAHRVDDAGKFHQHAVAGGLHDAAAMASDPRIDQLVAQSLEPLEGRLLIGAHQARISRHIGGEDRGQAAVGAFVGKAVLPNPRAPKRLSALGTHFIVNEAGRHSLFKTMPCRA